LKQSAAFCLLYAWLRGQLNPRKMANVELGLAIGFYLYPCGLIVTLLLSQLVRYRYKDASNGPEVDEKSVEKIQRFYARGVWWVQLALTPLLVCLHLALISLSRADYLL
jgi:hypothetical protein